MTVIERRATIDASSDDVWRVLADFAGIATWASNVDHSSAMTEPADGPHAVRRVQVGRSALVETVDAWEPGTRLSYEITGLPPVIRRVVTSWTIGAVGERAAVTVTTEIDAGPRPPQRLIAKLVGRRFATAADEMLIGLAAHLRERSSS